MGLFNLRYRKAVAGVTVTFIEARDLETAEKVGRAYCARLQGARFITIEPAVSADESILGDARPPAELPPAVERPSVTEQRAAQVQRTQEAQAAGNIAEPLRADPGDAPEAAPAAPPSTRKPAGRIGA
jgi:hypothetical protein